MKLFLSSIFLLVLAPCNSEQKLSSSTDTEYSTTIIEFAEEACYGECPIYKMILDGKTMTATFKGEANTSKIGTYTKAISKEEFGQFVEGLNKINFDNLSAEYLGNIPDFPIRVTTLTKDGKTKTVRNRSEGPQELDALEKEFRSYGQSEGWKKQEASN